LQPDGTRVWMCLRVCNGSKLPGNIQEYKKPSRTIEWQEFCDLNNMGDLVYDVKFEGVSQSQAKIDYLMKFSKKPSGIIYMYGKPGTGKSYAAMALCELFTRNNSSCKWYTQEKMASQWLETFKENQSSNFRSRLETCSILVIDDFGTTEPPPGFLKFFMDLVSYRMQWSNKGTVITTNLDPDNTLPKFCGDTLMDRLRTGQGFKFEGPSRRKKTDL
jgi:DNA replication protein DnaC